MSESAHSAPRWGIPSIVALIALAVVPGMFATGFTEYETVKKVVLIALAGVGLLAWGLGVLRGKTISMIAGRSVSVAVAFAAFVGLSILWAPSAAAGVIPALYWVALVSLFLFVVAPVGKPLNFTAVAAASGIGAALAGTFGLLDLAGVGIFSHVWDAPGAAGAFDAREFGVGYYAAVVPFLAAAAVRTTGPVRILTALGGLLAAAHFGLVADINFLIIWGVAVGAVTLLVALLQGFDRLPLLFGAFIAVAIAGLVALGLSLGGPAPGKATDATSLPWLTTAPPKQAIASAEIRDSRFAIRRTEEAPNWEARSYVTGVAFDLFREQPIVGVGPGGWWAMQTKYARDREPFVQRMFNRWPAFRSPHNAYALVMVEFGGVGLFLLLAWISTVLGMTVTALAKKQEPENWLIEHWALTCAVVAAAVLAVFTPALERAPAAVFLFVAAALLTRESAALNEFRGLSQVWTLNREGRRKDTGFFAGVLPMAVGAAAVVAAGWFAAAEFYRSWGDLMMLRTEHPIATRVYGEADQIWGGDGDVLYNRAIALKRQGKGAEAVETVNKAAELRPYDIRIVNLLSAIHITNQDYDAAVKAARRAVELYPNYIDGRRSLATALDLQGRVNEAAAQLVEILELDPPDDIKGRVHRDLGKYYEGPLTKPAKALEHYEQAMVLLNDQFLKEDLKPRMEELKKEIERNRLMREGKPIPPDLMPGAPDKGHKGGPPGHEGHGH